MLNLIWLLIPTITDKHDHLIFNSFILILILENVHFREVEVLVGYIRMCILDVPYQLLSWRI